MAPELVSGAMALSEEDLHLELASASPWDLATRYHEFSRRASMRKMAHQLRRISAEAVLQKAQEIIGSAVHPVQRQSSPWSELPGDAFHPELDLDETLENSVLSLQRLLTPGSHEGISPQDIWMSYDVRRHQPLVLSVDTSLSMTGEKLALTAVALAVVLLEFPEDPIGIVAFENAPKVLKRPSERLSVRGLVERFLDVPAQGYTHLEDGMKAALELSRDPFMRQAHSRPPSTLLVTDGKYTAGRDPAYLASRFGHLVVIKMGVERASLELCREMAQRGRGSLKEVGDLEDLPQIMYGVVKDLLRGRSLSA